MAEQQALEQRKWSPAEIRKMIELRRDGRFGFEELNPAALNAVYLLCSDMQLLPGDEVIGYQGKPYINARGTLTLARRHPEYRGFSQRPLTLEEKELWGYEPEDIVVATTFRTASWGDIEQHGKVAKGEVEQARQQAIANQKRAAPVGTSPVEMAMKRSMMRAAGAAFGWDAVPTEEQVLEGKYDIKQVEREMAAEKYGRLDRVFAGEVEVEHESQEVEV
jgi:hypothetical protein